MLLQILKFIKLIEDEWRIYASVYWFNIGSDNSLYLTRHQVIINVHLLSVGTLAQNPQKLESEIIFIHENIFKDVGKMVAIYTGPQGVDLK